MEWVTVINQVEGDLNWTDSWCHYWAVLIHCIRFFASGQGGYYDWSDGITGFYFRGRQGQRAFFGLEVLIGVDVAMVVHRGLYIYLLL